MTVLAIVLGNVLVGFLVGCRVAASLAWWWAQAPGWEDKIKVRYGGKPERVVRAPSGEQWFGAACFGFVAACVWPLALVLLLAKTRLLAPPQDIEVKRQEQRIRELEEELGVAS